MQSDRVRRGIFRILLAQLIFLAGGQSLSALELSASEAREQLASLSLTIGIRDENYHIETPGCGDLLAATQH